MTGRLEEMQIIRSVLVLMLLHPHTCLGLKVIVPGDPVTALVGSAVLLPCKYRIKTPPLVPKFLSVLWKFGEEEVLNYSSSRTVSKPGAWMDQALVSDGDVSLRLNNVIIHDEGTYRCIVTYSPVSEEEAIELHVQASPLVKMTIKHQTWSRKVQLQCLVTGFYPGDVKVTWFRDRQPLETPEMGEPQRNTDGTYRMHSSVVLTRAETQSHPVMECQVEHRSLEKPINETFMVEEDKTMMPARNIVILVVVIIVVVVTCVIVRVYFMKRKTNGDPTIKLSLNELGYVVCSFHMENLKDLQVTWSYADEKSEHLKDITDIGEPEKNVCSFPGVMFNRPGFKVRVTWSHAAMDGADWREVSATDIPWHPQMSDIITDRWVHGAEVQLRCTISRYFPDSLAISWFRSEPGNEELIPVYSSEKYRLPGMTVTKEADNTYTCVAVLTVNVSADMDDGVEFFCQVEHPSQWRILEKRTGELHVTAIPAVGVSYTGDSLKQSLVAEVQGFYPGNVEITWSCIEGNEKQEHQKAINECSSNSDGTFRLLSICEDRSSHNLTEKTFKLAVSHQTLEAPIKMIITRKKGTYYLITEEGETSLPQQCS
uniref:Ig-like domain-containing protein n=1 Tax=Leptobrachium leishanense TaxID=445787 RepID=A0A8C5QC79_9ANUR